MNSALKKAFLIYLLILFTSISGNTIDSKEEWKHAGGELEGELIQPAFGDKSELVEPARQNVVPDYNPEEIQLSPDKGIIPISISIPALEVATTIIPVGKLENGQMGVPKSIHTVGWYELGVLPGMRGNAVLAGHVDGQSQPGVFFNLKKLKKGDEIHVKSEKGETLTFRVMRKQSYSPENAPLEDIFGYSSNAHLNLITCTGNFNTKTGHYEDRLVVYTELVKS